MSKRGNKGQDVLILRRKISTDILKTRPSGCTGREEMKKNQAKHALTAQRGMLRMFKGCVHVTECVFKGYKRNKKRFEGS